MSVATTGNGSPRTLDQNRPAPMEVHRLPVNNNNDISATLGVIRQSTITGSLGDESPRVDTQRTVHQHHYEVPNLSSMLYEYTHKESDRVQDAFRTGNYHSLRDLPRHLLPGNVSTWSRSKIESNLFNPAEERRYVEL